MHEKKKKVRVLKDCKKRNIEFYPKPHIGALVFLILLIIFIVINYKYNMLPSKSLPSNLPVKSALFDYAYIGSYAIAGGESNIENTLQALKALAMNENWEYSKTANIHPLPILYNYLIHTFNRVQEEVKIAEKDNFSCFNTGLVTENQEEIFMLFGRNKTKGSWKYLEFCKESSNDLTKFNPLPERAKYFDDPSDLIYDTRLELRINIDHIVNDPDNFARFPQDIQQLSTHQLINTFRGAVVHANKRVKRNYLTAIPQYYRGKYVPKGQLQLLLPLCLKDPTRADLALAVYKQDGTYSGRTCLTLDMAINNARLITKPDDEWLRP